MHRNAIHRGAAVAVALTAGAALLAGCGDGGGTEHGGGHDGAGTPTASSSEATFNSADVAFATGMIPHHAQAIEMSDLAATRAANPQVKALAAQVKAAQGPEITQMTSWLKAWGKPVPSTSGGHDGGHGGDMPGMMSADDMAKLKAASGPAFDRMFLEMMIRHHEGAIAMADKEKAEGLYPEAKKVAQDIATSQAAEIKTMRDLLTKL